ncbi:MAG: DNA-binding transcriptional regulator, PadR family, partial [Daejeonella sp.]|nr:DNA-binding transcriptional regulator, PadR family [Daejeonella sp.]
IVDNRVRKYYRLTHEGKKTTTDKIKEAENFIVQLQALLNIKPNIA